MERWRRGGHHIGFGFGLIAVLFILFVLYRIVVNSGIIDRVVGAVEAPAHYELIVHLPEGKTQKLDVYGKVKVENSYVKITTNNETYYYQVPPLSTIVVRKLEE